MGGMRNEYKISLKILRRRDHAEDLGVHGRIILNKIDLREIWKEDVDWINLAQDRDRW
jgi:hypothetical protein